MKENEWTKMIHEKSYENEQILFALLQHLKLTWVEDHNGNKYLIETPSNNALNPITKNVVD